MMAGRTLGVSSGSIFRHCLSQPERLQQPTPVPQFRSLDGGDRGVSRAGLWSRPDSSLQMAVFSSGPHVVGERQGQTDRDRQRDRQLPARAGVPDNPEFSLQRQKVIFWEKQRHSPCNLLCGFCII